MVDLLWTRRRFVLVDSFEAQLACRGACSLARPLSKEAGEAMILAAIDDPKRHVWTPNCGSRPIVDAKGFRECWACARPRDEHLEAEDPDTGAIVVVTSGERHMTRRGNQ